MNGRMCGVLAWLAWLAWSAGAASGQVTYFDVFYYGYTAQYDDLPPPPADQYYFSGRIFCTGAGDIGAVDLLTPESPILETLNHEHDGLWSFYSGSFPTQAEVFAAYPRGFYTFFIEGGTLGDQIADIDRQEELFPPEPPAYTDGTVAALQGFDAARDLTIHFSPFGVQPGGNVAVTYVSVYGRPGSEFLYAAEESASATSSVIPAGAIPPDSEVAVYVTHSSRLQYPDGGFDGAWAVIAFDLSTYTEGYSASGEPPCPADFNRDGGIDGADVDAFFAAWENGDPAADVNLDGGVDGADVDTFFVAWEAGGCG